MSEQKTVVIYDRCGEDYIQFFIADGNKSHLNNKYVNGAGNSKVLENELWELLGFDEDGNMHTELLAEFPTQAVIDGAKVITIGFLP